MSRYQIEEYRQLQDARTDLALSKLTSHARICAIDAITIVINIMLMIDDADNNRLFTTKEIFEHMYKTRL